MQLLARFAGSCKGCGKRFDAGASVEWTKDTGVTQCPSCAGTAAKPKPATKPDARPAAKPAAVPAATGARAPEVRSVIRPGQAAAAKDPFLTQDYEDQGQYWRDRMEAVKRLPVQIETNDTDLAVPGAVFRLPANLWYIMTTQTVVHRPGGGWLLAVRPADAWEVICFIGDEIVAAKERATA